MRRVSCKPNLFDVHSPTIEPYRPAVLVDEDSRFVDGIAIPCIWAQIPRRTQNWIVGMSLPAINAVARSSYANGSTIDVAESYIEHIKPAIAFDHFAARHFC